MSVQYFHRPRRVLLTVLIVRCPLLSIPAVPLRWFYFPLAAASYDHQAVFFDRLRTFSGIPRVNSLLLFFPLGDVSLNRSDRVANTSCQMAKCTLKIRGKRSTLSAKTSIHATKHAKKAHAWSRMVSHSHKHTPIPTSRPLLTQPTSRLRNGADVSNGGQPQ